jgi:hypothetical protein
MERNIETLEKLLADCMNELEMATEIIKRQHEILASMGYKFDQ